MYAHTRMCACDLREIFNPLFLRNNERYSSFSKGIPHRGELTFSSPLCHFRYHFHSPLKKHSQTH